MHRPSLLLLICVVALSLLSGCKSDEPKPAAALSDDNVLLDRQRSRGLVEMRPSPIPDVPVAIGFTTVPSKSAASTGPHGIRTIDFLVQGWSTVQDVQHFYRQNTLNYGWQPLTTDGFSFVKGPERLDVVIWRGDNAIINVRLRVSPR